MVEWVMFVQGLLALHRLNLGTIIGQMLGSGNQLLVTKEILIKENGISQIDLKIMIQVNLFIAHPQIVVNRLLHLIQLGLLPLL
jgi:hypothetical protein